MLKACSETDASEKYTVYSLSLSYKLNITTLMWTISCLLWNQVYHIPRPCILSRPTMLSFGLSDWLLTEFNFPHHPKKMTLREEAQLYFQHIRTVFWPYNTKWARIYGERRRAEPGRKTIIKSWAEGKKDVCASEGGVVTRGANHNLISIQRVTIRYQNPSAY